MQQIKRDRCQDFIVFHEVGVIKSEDPAIFQIDRIDRVIQYP